MKFLTCIFIFLFSVQAHAHEDHFLGEGIVHNLVHATLVFLLVGAVVAGIKWFKAKSLQLKKIK